MINMNILKTILKTMGVFKNYINNYRCVTSPHSLIFLPPESTPTPTPA